MGDREGVPLLLHSTAQRKLHNMACIGLSEAQHVHTPITQSYMFSALM